MLMNANAVVHALAAVTVPAEDLIFLLFRIFLDVRVILGLCAVAFLMPIVVDVVDREKKRLRLTATGAFVTEELEKGARASQTINFPISASRGDALGLVLALFVVLSSVDPLADQAKSIRFPAPDDVRIMAASAKSFHVNRIAQKGNPFVF